jgi:CubicO group peptidase (beta-lactamase class C family)
VEPMTVDSVFDLASLTKPVATATGIMLLVERGELRLGSRIASVFPEFGEHGKDRLTVTQLLTHQGGLIADNALRDYQDGPQMAWERICGLKPVAEAGERFLYSDVGFIVLGKLVERICGASLDAFTRAEVFEPLGMSDTGYQPAAELCRRAVATEQRDGRWLKGEVHDPRAFALEGIAGHAGLFSTAEDLAVYAQMMLQDGEYRGVRILSPRAVQVMTRGVPVPSGVRGLGWDKQTGYSTNRGDLLTESAYGHGGFTGTSLWIDPDLDLFVIFLSTRLHPDGKGTINPLAGRIANIAAGACPR